MSAIYKYTIDSFGFVPRLWQIWRDPVRGAMRCIAREHTMAGSRERWHITAEILPRGWRVN